MMWVFLSMKEDEHNIWLSELISHVKEPNQEVTSE